MPVKIVQTKGLDMGYEDTWIVELNLQQQRSFSALCDKFRSMDMKITENDEMIIYWKDPTEQFVKIRNDESLQAALRVGERLTAHFVTFKVNKL